MPAGNSLDQRSIGTDYNLQISNGIQNFQMWKQAKRQASWHHSRGQQPPWAARYARAERCGAGSG